MTPRDVGGWFRTAVDGAVALPTKDAWGPGTGGFGRISHDDDLVAAANIFRGRPTMMLTGAGMSTASGLPDYRGRDAVPRSPMMFQEFIGSDLSRRRYWARSTVGWSSFANAQPNAAHHLVVELSGLTPVTGIVTQNVDGLHQKAGSDPVIDLHGNLSEVMCLDCGHRVERAALQRDLLDLNPQFAQQLPQLASNAATAPDGDAEVDRTQDFVYPSCGVCRGMLKPNVVFFGENAHRETVEAANRMLDASDVLVILGSSLTVMSGLRFARRSERESKEIIIVNDGTTRGDDVATLRLHGQLEPILRRWVTLLTR